nr:ASCH domain-containing protein [Ectothiorhodospira shaposhnikovii]
MIIADPWIGHILDGTKTWEMRSASVSHRGWFGLIRKGTGAVYGVARLTDVGAPLSLEEMVSTYERHRIPERQIRSGEVAKWNIPWKLEDVRRLASPVPYRHRNGAVTWVELGQDVSDAIARQIGEIPQPHVAPAATPLPSQHRSAAPQGERAPASMPAKNVRLIGQVQITQGNINNNHIYLREFFDRFPEEVIGGSNRREEAARTVTVDWGGDALVQTDLDGSKRLFRARSWVRNFFELNDAAAGDWVLVEEIGFYTYRVRLVKRGGVHAA